jgi:hypothetical protein
VIRAAVHAATRCASAITALLPGIYLRDITFEEENKWDSLQPGGTPVLAEARPGFLGVARAG